MTLRRLIESGPDASSGAAELLRLAEPPPPLPNVVRDHVGVSLSRAIAEPPAARWAERFAWGAVGAIGIALVMLVAVTRGGPAGEDAGIVAEAPAPAPSPVAPSGQPRPTEERSVSPPAQPRADTGLLHVVTTPVAIVQVGGRTLGATPLRDLLPAGRHTLHLLYFTAGGASATREAQVTIRAGELTELSLDLLASSPPAEPPSTRRAPRPEPRPRPFDPAPAPAPASDGLGRLLINSVPWSEVSVDGRHIGNTPIVSLQLRAGRHRVTLRTADGQTRTLTVVIHAGETHRFSVRFD